MKPADRINFLKSFSTVAIGLFLAQLLSLIAIPVISRTYSKSMLGQFGAYTSVISILTPTLTLQLAQPLQMAKRGSESNRIAISGIIIAAATSIISCTIVCAFQTPTLTISVLFFISTISVGISQISASLNIKEGRFNLNACAQITRSTTANFTMLLFGIISPASIFLFFAHALGELTFLIVSIHKNLRTLVKLLSRSKQLHNIRIQLSTHKHFATYGTAQCLVSACTSGLPILIFSRYYNLEFVGIFIIASKVIIAPTCLLAEALRQTLFQKLCENQSTPDANHLICKRFTQAIISISVVITICGFTVLPAALRGLLGKSWSQAGTVIPWITLWQCIYIAIVPSVLQLRLLYRQGYYFFHESISLLFTTAILIYSCQRFHPTTAVAILCLSNVGFGVFLIVITLYFSTKSLKSKTSSDNRRGSNEHFSST